MTYDDELWLQDHNSHTDTWEPLDEDDPRDGWYFVDGPYVTTDPYPTEAEAVEAARTIVEDMLCD